MSRLDLSDQGGFTLIELLVVILIGMIVMSAGLGLMEASGRSTDRINDKVDTAQRGRVAMSAVARQLRAQVCVAVPGSSGLETRPPIAAGTDSSVTFYNEIDGDPAFFPTMTQLSYDNSTKQITQATWTPPAGSTGQTGWTFPETNKTTRVLANGVLPVTDSGGQAQPIFQYRGFDTSLDTPRAALTAPLSSTIMTADGVALPANSIARVARVDVAFRVGPAGNSNSSTAYEVKSRQSDFKDTVYLRNALYTDQTAEGAAAGSAEDKAWAAACD